MGKRLEKKREMGARDRREKGKTKGERGRKRDRGK
jgi:hypothetical protein